MMQSYRWCYWAIKRNKELNAYLIRVSSNIPNKEMLEISMMTSEHNSPQKGIHVEIIGIWMHVQFVCPLLLLQYETPDTKYTYIMLVAKCLGEFSQPEDRCGGNGLSRCIQQMSWWRKYPHWWLSRYQHQRHQEQLPPKPIVKTLHWQGI